MPVESQGIDPYDHVLADLKAKREQIDQAIAAIESVRGGTPSPVKEAPQGNGSNGTGDLGGPGGLLGLSIVDAAKKVMTARPQPLKTADILEALKAGGLPLTAKEPLNVVGSVLTRRFNEVGDVVRVSRGVWGLKEWYPNRSFKKEKEATKEDGVKPEPEGWTPDSKDWVTSETFANATGQPLKQKPASARE